jgi:hypothetical protein
MSPQEDQSRRETENASPGMENAPPPNHAAGFSRGTARRCVHQAAIGRHHHEHRVGPIYEQNGGSEQPTPLEGAKKATTPKNPPAMAKLACIMYPRL